MCVWEVCVCVQYVCVGSVCVCVQYVSCPLYTAPCRSTTKPTQWPAPKTQALPLHWYTHPHLHPHPHPHPHNPCTSLPQYPTVEEVQVHPTHSHRAQIDPCSTSVWNWSETDQFESEFQPACERIWIERWIWERLWCGEGHRLSSLYLDQGEAFPEWSTVYAGICHSTAWPTSSIPDGVILRHDECIYLNQHNMHGPYRFEEFDLWLAGSKSLRPRNHVSPSLSFQINYVSKPNYVEMVSWSVLVHSTLKTEERNF